MTADVGVPEEIPGFPLPRTDPLAPPPGYSLLRDGPPRRVRLPHGDTPWLLTRYEDVRAALVDPRLSSDSRNPRLPQVVPLPPGPSRVSFLRMDDPRHGVLRRMLTPEFTPRRMQSYRPWIARAVDELLDDLIRRGPVADLVEALAWPLPSLVISKILGVPYEDRVFFQANSKIIASGAGSAQEIAKAYADMSDYLDQLVRAKEAQPLDDVLSRVALSYVATGQLGHDELVAMARLLLVAGHDTTANMLGLSVLTLLQNPGQRDRLRAEPELMPAAVDELMRFLSVSQSGTVRVVTADTSIGGQRMSAGDGILLALPAANHDERAFPVPERLDIGRDSHKHLGFGYGMHQCLGKPLAKIELEIALTAIFQRLPELRLAVGYEQLRFRHDGFVYGTYELPADW